MARAPLQESSVDWATPLSQRFLGGRSRYLTQIPRIDRDSLPKEMEVRIPTIGCYRRHHAPKPAANLDAPGCRGPLSWKGKANRSYRSARQTKPAELVHGMVHLS